MHAFVAAPSLFYSIHNSRICQRFGTPPRAETTIIVRTEHTAVAPSKGKSWYWLRTHRAPFKLPISHVH